MSFDAAFASLRDAIAAGRIAGGVLAVSDGGGRRVAPAGAMTFGEAAEPIQADTIFDLASLTKVIFTTERILSLAASGRLQLDEPLSELIPDLRQYDRGAWERQVTVRQCLGHMTPFPAVAPIYTHGNDPATLRAYVLQHPWERVPTPVYSDINFILLGIAIERLEGRSITQMHSGVGFTFAPPPQRCAPTEHCMWRGRVLRGEVHDENAFALQGAGHAGLFGTAAAVLDFGKTVLARGPGLVGEPLRPTRTHGWEHSHPGWSGGTACSDETIGHTGFTGTGLWIDFAARRVWTLLTNHVHPTRHRQTGIQSLRQTVGTAISGG